MTIPAFYLEIHKFAEENIRYQNVTIRDLFKNYRNGKGLNLSKLGLSVMNLMNFECDIYMFDKDTIKFTPKLRILMDKYNKYPYYIDKTKLVLFGQEDRVLFKLYGSDVDTWIDHMESNL